MTSGLCAAPRPRVAVAHLRQTRGQALADHTCLYWTQEPRVICWHIRTERLLSRKAWLRKASRTCRRSMPRTIFMRRRHAMYLERSAEDTVSALEPKEATEDGEEKVVRLDHEFKRGVLLGVRCGVHIRTASLMCAAALLRRARVCRSRAKACRSLALECNCERAASCASCRSVAARATEATALAAHCSLTAAK